MGDASKVILWALGVSTALTLGCYAFVWKSTNALRDSFMAAIDKLIDRLPCLQPHADCPKRNDAERTEHDGDEQ